MAEQSHLVGWLLFWLACLGWVLYLQRQDRSGAGLVTSYVLQLWVIHWLGASIFALPWFSAMRPGVFEGVQQSTYAIAGFAAGYTVIALAMARRGRADHTDAESDVDPRLVRYFLGAGMVCFLIEPSVHSIPTIGAIASVGANLLLVGLAMECWNGLRDRRKRRYTFWRTIAAVALLPIVTVITKGFLSYGFAAMLTVFSFVAGFFKPRRQLVVCGVLAGYMALSVYVTYMRDRREIRATVWGQESYSARLTTLGDSVAEFELLDPTNIDHLLRIDDRLNQNALVGSAVTYLDTFPELFAHGRTVWEAFVALVPRALWPDRPVAAGSGDLVSEFTGITFDENTSVGIGHVLEWYVNYGTAGVFWGMAFIGLVVGYLDKKAVQAIQHGDWFAFTAVWLPGLSLLQVGGSFVDAMSGAAAGAAVAYLCKLAWVRFMGVRLSAPHLTTATRRPTLAPSPRRRAS